MLANRLTFLFLLSFVALLISCKENDETGQNPLDQRLLGKWNVVAKTDTEKVGDAELYTERKTYAKGEKTYKFTANHSLIITDGYGQNLVTLPVQMEGENLYIGEPHPSKVPYKVSFSENKAILIKVEVDPDDDKPVTQTEEVVLER